MIICFECRLESTDLENLKVVGRAQRVVAVVFPGTRARGRLPDRQRTSAPCRRPAYLPDSRRPNTRRLRSRATAPPMVKQQIPGEQKDPRVPARWMPLGPMHPKKNAVDSATVQTAQIRYMCRASRVHDGPTEGRQHSDRPPRPAHCPS